MSSDEPERFPRSAAQNLTPVEYPDDAPVFAVHPIFG